MARTMQTARKSTGGVAPRKMLEAPVLPDETVNAFTISGCDRYAAHMNGTYVKRRTRYAGRPAYRCVENPRLCITFMRPSATPVSRDRYLKRVFLLGNDSLVQEVKTANQFSGWVAQWSKARGYRRGYLRSTDAGAVDPTCAEPGSWQVMTTEEQDENPVDTSSSWDAFDEESEKCIQFKSIAVAVKPATESMVAEAKQRRRAHNARVATALAHPAPIVLGGGYLLGCRQEVWYPAVETGSEVDSEDSWDDEDRMAAEDDQELAEEAAKEAERAHKKLISQTRCARFEARNRLLHTIAAQWAPPVAEERAVEGGDAPLAPLPPSTEEPGGAADGRSGEQRTVGLVWASSIEAVLQQVHPDATLDAGAVCLVHELITQAFEAIVDSAWRASAQPAAGKLPSFIESSFPTRVEYEAWVAKEATAAAAAAGSALATTDGLKLLSDATGACLPGELAKHARAFATKALTGQQPGASTVKAFSQAVIATALAARLDGRTPDSMGMPPPSALRSAEAAQYLASVVEYLAAELLELAGNMCRDGAVRMVWKGTDLAHEAMQFDRSASQLSSLVRADPTSADAAVTAAIDALAVVRDLEEDDATLYYDEVREEESPVRRSHVLLAINYDEDLTELWGVERPTHQFAGGCSRSASWRLSVAGEPGEVALLTAILSNGTAAERAAEAMAEAAFQDERAAAASAEAREKEDKAALRGTRRRLTYVANKEGKMPSRFSCKPISYYDASNGQWRIEYGDGWAESALGSDAATPCEVDGWEYDDGHYAKWGLTRKIGFASLASVRWRAVRSMVRVRPYVLAWQEHTAERLYAADGAGREADKAAFEADFRDRVQLH